MRTFLIETWGCQMNQHDSEHLEGQLRALGLSPAEAASSADLVLLNTCSVREKPVHKIVSRIGELEKLPEPPMIGVCGCVAQQEGEKLLARSSAVAFVLGPGQNGRLAEALRLVEQGRRPVLTGFDARQEYNFEQIFRISSTRGMITVVEGCNEFCTFCVVPYTRGREISRPMEGVLAEARHLVATGLKEVELLGQTINAYRCPETDADFAELLDRVAAVRGLERVRFITSHPRHFSDRLIDVLARHPKVSRYLHLPVQSGSDAILRRMHRRYSREEYISLVERLRGSVPEVNLSTDIIVGFPGETESDFTRSLELLEQIRFGQVFAFAYSPRPRTPAALYGEQLPAEVVSERLQRLFSLTEQISVELNEAMVGSVVPVLIDGTSRRGESQWQGRGEDNRVINFPRSGAEQLGDIVQVRVDRAGPHSLVGEIVAEDPRHPTRDSRVEHAAS